MSTLLLRLAAPLQAWGSNAKFERRGTERAPTKSGVIGMLAAALGRRREEPVDDLLHLHFGVRVDQEGVLLRDYHTARRDKLAYVTHRYYLSDAIFLVGLEGDDTWLAQLDYALRHPVFPLFLGRRSCPPAGQVSLGIRQDRSLLEALEGEPIISSSLTSRSAVNHRLVRLFYDANDTDTGTYYMRDLPMSFDSSHRRYGFRRVAEASLTLSSVQHQHEVEKATAEPVTAHDPFNEWED